MFLALQHVMRLFPEMLASLDIVYAYRILQACILMLHCA